MQPVAGLSLGAYRLLKPIGEGGMGVVWRARDQVLDRDVAIKFLPTECSQDADRLARFQREAKAVAALSHPGILSIYGFGEQDGTSYAVMELLHGETLRELLASGPVSPPLAIDIVRQTARALAAAHGRGIVHRDLKPENLFLTREGHLKILDFGLAAQLGVGVTTATPDASLAPTRTSLTTPGTVLGTTDYLSPEQVRTDPADARSDIFSLGSVLYELLTGSRPFHRRTAADTMTAILKEDPPIPSNMLPPLARIVRRCLAKDPDQRFASAQELSAALDEADAAAAVSARPRSLARLPASIVVVLGLVGIGLWTWRLSGRGDESASAPPVSVTSIGEVRSPDSEANEYFERGLLFLRAQFDLPYARQMLDRALEIDPSFGAARAMRAITGLISVHEGFTNDGSVVYASERDARETLVAQPNLAVAHAALGAALLCSNRKEQARHELEASMRLDPRSQPAAIWFALDDRHSGRFEVAETRLREILEDVPLFWATRIILSDVLFDQGRLDEAQREVEKVFEQDADNLAAVRALARIRIYAGDDAGARELLERIGAATHANFRVRLTWALLLAHEGQDDDALAVLDADTLKYADIALFAPAQVAEVYALAGRVEEALDWLEHAARDGDERAPWFRRDELLASLRAEARFELILDAIERGRDPT